MFTKNLIFSAVLVSTVMMLSGCELVGDIFQAGLWVGIIIIVVIVALVGFIFNKFRGPRP